MSDEPEPCRADDGDDFDAREQYLLRKLRHLRARQEECRLDILSAENALTHLRSQAGPDPPEMAA